MNEKFKTIIGLLIYHGYDFIFYNDEIYGYYIQSLNKKRGTCWEVDDYPDHIYVSSRINWEDKEKNDCEVEEVMKMIEKVEEELLPF